MPSILMKCNHRAHAIRRERPICAICYGTTPDAEIIQESPDLTKREMECKECGKKIPSSLSYALFEYRPDKPTDAYYCGCKGWE